MKPTITDIARASGVSKGTVSRVLNGHRTVAPATRVRVEEVMAHLGYQPDQAARHLSWRSGRSLGMSVLTGDPLLSPYQVLLRRAIEREVGPVGLALHDLGEDLASHVHLPSAVLVMHLRGNDPRLGLLRARGVPAVVVGHHPAWSWVAPDDRGGAALAARTLTDLGHRDVLMLGGGEGQVARDRGEGFVLAARAAGASARVLTTDFTLLGGYRAVRRSLEGGWHASGVFAATDEMAVGAVAALHDGGLRVPQDVSMIGFDGLPELPQVVGFAGRLTTVAQDISQIAKEALSLVQEALAGGPPRGVRVPVRLVSGETTAPFGG